MALGKAFIEVHADTKPFARELGRDLIKILEAAEKDVRKLARQTGETIATETGKGIGSNSKKINAGIAKALTNAVPEGAFSKLSKGIIDSIDDGLSGLPAEVKIALAAALVAILPAIGAAITAVTNAIIGAAFVGLGFLIASQFAEVQTGWEALLGDLERVFIGNGTVFVEPVLNAFTLIRERLFELEGWFREIFAAAAQLVEPVTLAFLGFINGLLPGLLDSINNSVTTIAVLEDAFFTLGRVVGETLRIISGSQYADEGFRDLVFVIGSLLLGTAQFIRALTEIYGRLRDISILISGGPAGIAALFGGKAFEENAQKAREAASANGLWANSFSPLAAAAERQTAAFKDLNNQLAAYERMVLAQINNEIAWEQAIDDFTASVRENGRTLKLSEQAGRDNANALLALAQAALKTRTDQINMGVEVGVAQKRFDEQKAAIYALAEQMKLGKVETDRIVGALLNIPPPAPTGVDAASITRLQKLLTLIQQIYSAPGFGAIFGAAFAASKNARTPAYANGGIVTGPHMGLVGEAGPEAIIPLNKPARAAQLLNQSGLSGMMAPTVNVYIGNRQLDPYIDSRTDARNTSTARSLAYGSRGI